MVKDRLGEVLQVSNKSKDVRVKVEDEPPDTNNLRTTFERADVLGLWINKVEKNVEIVKDLISQLSDISVPRKDIDAKIDSYFQNNTSICHKINGKLKELEEELKSINNETAEGRIKTIQYNTLKTRYVEALKRNNRELELYKNSQKSMLEAQFRAKGIRVTDEELVALLDENVDIQVFTENIISETAEAKRTLADIEERHQQLLKVERMLIEVRDLFLQMAILIDEQQDLIDRVEYQAGLAREYVGRTPHILSDAANKKKTNLKCKIILIAVVIVFIIILLTFLFK